MNNSYIFNIPPKNYYTAGYRILMFFLICFLGSSYLHGQDISFRSLTPEDGLSQISVNDLYQDERGFIWIGTREGLNCYNGSGIETYKFRKDDPASIFSNSIEKLTGNGDGEIYVLCSDGISVWDMKKERFTTILETPNAKAIHYNKELYSGINHEIYTFNNNDQFKHFYSLPSQQSIITAIFIDKEENVWIGTYSDGLFRLTTDKKLEHLIPKANITRIYMDNDGDIWIGSWEHGLYCFAGDEMLHYTHTPGYNSISSDFVRAFCQDNQGNLWIGTFLGLDKLNKSTGEFTFYSTDSYNTNKMTHHSIWTILKDHQGTIWFGTYFGGVNYFNPEYEIYTHYSVSQDEQSGLSSPIVGKMTEDDKGNLWICTEGGGVNVYDRKRKSFKWYRHDPLRNSISHDNVKTIYFDSDAQVVWIGTHLGGLNKLDLRTDRFTHYRASENDPFAIPSDIVRDIIPYKQELIIATQNGVCMFNPATGKCRQLFKDTAEGRTIKTVSALFIDYYGTLWIAAIGEGVFSYNFETSELINYRTDPNDPYSISNNNINHIVQDHYYNLWFSTSGSGLDLFNYESKDFTNYDSQKNGLSSDCVYEVCESRYGKLLIITNQGFGQFDRFEHTFYNYNSENGFPLSSINENALYLTNDGEVFLGSVQGMVSFYERDLVFTPKEYDIVPLSIRVNNIPVRVDDESGILSSSLYTSPDIVLKSKYSVFSVEFATTNYIPANRENLVYRLEGFSQDWLKIDRQQVITYTNLNPGKYRLVIRPEQPGIENIHESYLNITLLPPFYRTTLAYLLYFIFTAVLLYYLIISYKSRIKLQESLKYEQKHIQDVEQLNQSKLSFFTNISHEFRTPLTLIIGQIEMLMQIEAFTPKVYNKLLSVYNSSLLMRGLINELLDFRKQEQGHMTIKVSRHNLVDFLNENFLLFSEYATTRQISFVFRKEIDQIWVWYDAKQLQKVINNLISNAFKHTVEGDTITLSVSQENDYAVISVHDTGEGIESADLDKIFNRFYQTESFSSGTGIGLALSKGLVELHHGTISVESVKGENTLFTVRLKLGNSHFSEEQIKSGETVENTDSIQIEPAFEISGDMAEPVIPVPIDGAKILIVEDNETLRNMLAKIFEPFYSVFLAADGQEGLDRVKEVMPNLILSDVLMPNMSGVELCRSIKSDLETCHIPVVLLTARTAVEHTVEGLQNGADDYITKPFNIHVLVSRCNNLVNSRIVLQEKYSRQPQMTPLMLATNRLDKDMLDKVMVIVEENMTNPDFNVDLLADELGIARTNLYAKIKAITGNTPNKFILQIKLKKAAFLLRNHPELRISEISDMTGFTSAGYFGKCFKEAYRMTPLEFRSGEDSAESE